MILNRLDQVMREKETRNEDVAAKSGLSTMTIQNARKGKSVTHSTWNLIASALKVSKAALLSDGVKHGE